ncbi:hypothetical protein HYY69_06850 [Candidatus Woesearchaeota archaeon]|nr:hypothetical protein [Candidatus Woesearchaeota archaeon]
MEFAEVTEWGELEEVLRSTNSCITPDSSFGSVFPAYDKSKIACDDFQHNPAVKYFIYLDGDTKGYIRIFKQHEDDGDTGFIDYICPLYGCPVVLLKLLLRQTTMQRLYLNPRRITNSVPPLAAEIKTLHLELSPQHADYFPSNHRSYQVLVLPKE